MLRLLQFIVCTYALGFVAAIPVGATQLEIARRSIKGFLFSAMMIMVGSVLSDLMYGVIAFWGVFPFLRDPKVAAGFWLLGGIIMLVLGLMAIRDGRSPHGVERYSDNALQSKRIAFVTGFSLALTNPFMIAYWLIGAQFLLHLGVVGQYRTSDIIFYLSAGTAGIGSYLAVLSLGVYKVKRFFSEYGIRKITIGLGITLILASIYFLAHSVQTFTSGSILENLMVKKPTTAAFP
jgi:threonine/homoserine/homoserine lactone efflux protein